ncbi:hypothetical protein PENTCL1PPCAC_1226 [Pristionchus entomophagus]|uniref:C6 domain-containing protein n=1 Tax=Pristionchus entomophagus TaxID=358040 RepID=A0AAV5S7Y3_9BILA|nr:hypothetical protein PENTCL1PPCAC_1226 [Pristionchus entomophagus]
MLPSLITTGLLFLFISPSDGCMRVTPSTPGIVACKMCTDAMITKTANGNGAKPFDSDTTDSSGTCSVRTLVCTGENANVELNNGEGQIAGSLVVTCKADGSAWTYVGIDITQAECAAAP